jgi:hypothetical protein
MTHATGESLTIVKESHYARFPENHRFEPDGSSHYPQVAGRQAE